MSDRPALPTSPEDLHELAAIIAAFDAATAKLQASHSALQDQVATLTGELSRKNAELSASLAEVSALKNYLANILESISDGVVAIDLDRRVVALNQAAAAILPAIPPRREGEPVEGVFPPEGRELARVLVQALQSGRGQGNVEVQVTPEGGPPRSLSVSASPIRNEAGAVLGAVETFRDLTELKELEERARRRDRLTALGEMAAGVAHEIRNPLGGIALFASNLRRKLPAGSRESDQADRIVAAVASLDRIVADMLTFTRSRPPDRRPTPLEHVVGSALALAASTLSEKQIAVREEFATAEARYPLDSELLARAFLNVILNAAQVLPTGGRLTIALREERNGPQREAVAEFADEGPGIPPEISEQLFNPFFTTRKDGTGLGLAITHKIVQDHGGTITVRPNRPCGAVFSFRLPVPG